MVAQRAAPVVVVRGHCLWLEEGVLTPAFSWTPPSGGARIAPRHRHRIHERAQLCVTHTDTHMHALTCKHTPPDTSISRSLLSQDGAGTSITSQKRAALRAGECMSLAPFTVWALVVPSVPLAHLMPRALQGQAGGIRHISAGLRRQ